MIYGHALKATRVLEQSKTRVWNSCSVSFSSQTLWTSCDTSYLQLVEMYSWCSPTATNTRNLSNFCKLHLNNCQLSFTATDSKHMKKWFLFICLMVTYFEKSRIVLLTLYFVNWQHRFSKFNILIHSYLCVVRVSISCSCSFAH